MQSSSFPLIAIVLAIASGSLAQAPARQRLEQDQAKAIAALKKLGARILLDDDGQPIEVNLQETATGNDGLVHLAGLTTVREISLHQTKVTDQGLVHLKGLVHLERLFLSDTQTADEGLLHLAGLEKLKVLGIPRIA